MAPLSTLPAMCYTKGSIMSTDSKKRRRKPSSTCLCVEMEGGSGCGDGDERNRTENGDMSTPLTTHGNKDAAAAAVVVNGRYRSGGGEGSWVPIVEKADGSCNGSSIIAVKREGGGGDDHLKEEEGGGGTLFPKPLRIVVEDSLSSVLQCSQCKSSTVLMDMLTTTSSSFPHNNNNNNNTGWPSSGLRGTPTEEKVGGQNNNYVSTSRKLSFTNRSNTDDVVPSSYGIDDSGVILEHGSSLRTPDGGNLPHQIHRPFMPQTRIKSRSPPICSSNTLHVEDMCFSNLLERNSTNSPRPNLGVDHSPKCEIDACRTAFVQHHASASGVFPNSPSEIDSDGLSEWFDTQTDIGKTVL